MAKIVENNLIKISKEPFVILPLKKWKEMEELLEDLEIFRSKNLAKEIEKARKEIKKGKIISLEEVEKELNL